MKKKLIVLALHLAASGSDAYFTHRNQALRVHWEDDPIARPFVSHGTAGQIGYFAGTLALEMYGSHLLRKHDHPALANAFDAGMIATHATGAALSAHGYKFVNLSGKADIKEREHAK